MYGKEEQEIGQMVNDRYRRKQLCVFFLKRKSSFFLILLLIIIQGKRKEQKKKKKNYIYFLQRWIIYPQGYIFFAFSHRQA